MVTKAELEAEVAELRRQLAERSQTENPAETESVTEQISDTLDQWTSQIDEVLTEFEDIPHKKSIMFAIGIFAVGYLMGRSR
ncbi:MULTISPECIES: hypothetical protein [unclassified Ruegeria]|uniref:hypothetical protein n=1 Tax=unclassified Ruegeria TaxID=2625375 RepID=UPI001ADC5F91|nr:MULTISPECIES: hypothetical protein [unclassified Ruegeria]MBO9412518.1 hypothetical protein [Ruegeria sp. R8_1]MBO9416244.1 hypothetical protein [Ruegeria sp. R8_2]